MLFSLKPTSLKKVPTPASPLPLLTDPALIRENTGNLKVLSIVKTKIGYTNVVFKVLSYKLVLLKV